jgi:hypothetical protein
VDVGQDEDSFPAVEPGDGLLHPALDRLRILVPTEAQGFAADELAGGDLLRGGEQLGGEAAVGQEKLADHDR